MKYNFYERVGEDEYEAIGYEYEPDFDRLKDVLVEILMKDVESKEGVLFNKEGAYQMAVLK